MGFLKEYRDSKFLLSRRWPIVFFAEKGSDFQYMEHLLNLAMAETDVIVYITADKNDPLLAHDSNKLNVFYCKNFLAHVLNHLNADMVVMTMPDLDQFIYKRSATVDQYLYVFHALVSTHQQYRSGAFDHYDTILCAGPHHIREIRVREKMHQLPAKKLIPYGYPMLDKWKQLGSSDLKPGKILLAPSWYEQCILETVFDHLLPLLRKLESPVEIRFHPEFIKRRRKKYEQILKQVSGDRFISIDKRQEVWDSLKETSVLITDRSGIAFEFALATGKPVIFIDTPSKKFNHESEMLGIEPIEDAYRSRLGYRLDLSALDQLPELIKTIQPLDIQGIRNELVFETAENLKFA